MMDTHPAVLGIVFLAALWAGAQNALAGGGSFITLPALMLTGMDARAANVTSAIALFPGQVLSGWHGRSNAAGAHALSFKVLAIISLIGGALGALLLLATPSSFFAKLVPWLVLFATSVFAWGSFFRKPTAEDQHLGKVATGAAQLCISIYGGYFGGGIGFLMMAALTMAGLAVRNAGATKNLLAAFINFSAVAVFIFSPQVQWLPAAFACAGALVGGLGGAIALKRVNEKALRIAIVCIGAALTVGLFMRAQ
jgi:uncharacterized membrane protein YfcA